MADRDPNSLSEQQRETLRRFRWSPNSYLDLHEHGVHYFDPSYLPARLDAETYATMLHRGVSPPPSLPISAEGARERAERFLSRRYWQLAEGGRAYLGSEFNLQPPEAFDTARVRVCFCRLAPYRVVDGAFGGFLVGNFINDYAPSDEIFIDYAFMPAMEDLWRFLDADLPLMFGILTKRPTVDFDIIVVATSYPGERVNAPMAWVKSGLPLRRWERFSPDLPYDAKGLPLVVMAGIGASTLEDVAGDNPIHGVAGNSLFDLAVIGEGELADMKLFQAFGYAKRDGVAGRPWTGSGADRQAFIDTLDNRLHAGVYDPTRVLFEYGDKVHVERDGDGREVRRTTYPGGGDIRQVYLLDPDTRTKWALAGPDSQEFAQLGPIADQFRSRIGDRDDPEFGRRYVKVSDRPTLDQRKAAGMRVPTAEEAEEAKLERTRGARPI